MKFKNEAFVFKDRIDAGKELAKLLDSNYKKLNPLIIGIPRGGVEVAYYVAESLQTDLDVLVSKKLPYPGNKEYGFGAVAEDGSVYIAEERSEGLSSETVRTIIDKQLQEIQLRVEKYRQGRPVPAMEGRTVILVDDGIATGVTLVPLIQLCKKKKATKVVIAVPVAGRSFDARLEEADAIEVVVKPEPFFAVGQVYERFGDFPDDQLLKLLDRANGRSAH
ncbi:phosphoribosyltransferase [Olivibacter sp. XZL3]|uniref:phosphoribosyltransferase n=1 Tax=Olivibacter sp. XZL3 TaxID=1735116 RepID=UPI001066F303|nr:phosphoribosyltransferase family protein [Olivibacter sp. XZL3]